MYKVIFTMYVTITTFIPIKQQKNNEDFSVD